jgi:hypothetical protein
VLSVCTLLLERARARAATRLIFIAWRKIQLRATWMQVTQLRVLLERRV